MNYLVSTFDCYLFHEEKSQILANVKYGISKIQNNEIIFPIHKGNPFIFNTEKNCENILKVKLQNDVYFFLFAKTDQAIFVNEIKFNNHRIILSLSSKLFISVDGELICERNVENLTFSHYQIMENLCLIFFTGQRDFVVVLNQKELVYAEYYDECNITDKEKYFMSRLNDSLNHGYVCRIENNKADVYLVYLDDENLNLKDEFVPFVFLDCIKAKNYIYCNHLLSENIKLEDSSRFKEFFPDYDFYYPATKEKFILIKKNTLAGICEFVVENNQILNIIFH